MDGPSPWGACVPAGKSTDTKRSPDCTSKHMYRPADNQDWDRPALEAATSIGTSQSKGPIPQPHSPHTTAWCETRAQVQSSCADRLGWCGLSRTTETTVSVYTRWWVRLGRRQHMHQASQGHTAAKHWSQADRSWERTWRSYREIGWRAWDVIWGRCRIHCQYPNSRG